jgi:hypothetical protein
MVRPGLAGKSTFCALTGWSTGACLSSAPFLTLTPTSEKARKAATLDSMPLAWLRCSTETRQAAHHDPRQETGNAVEMNKSPQGLLPTYSKPRWSLSLASLVFFEEAGADLNIEGDSESGGEGPEPHALHLVPCQQLEPPAMIQPPTGPSDPCQEGEEQATRDPNLHDLTYRILRPPYGKCYRVKGQAACGGPWYARRQKGKEKNKKSHRLAWGRTTALVKRTLPARSLTRRITFSGE